MALIATASQQHKAISTWIAIALILFDAMALMDAHMVQGLSAQAIVWINIAGTLGIKIANVIKQNYAVPEEVKQELVSDALATRTKEAG
jgi:hypothetical protein